MGVTEMQTFRDLFVISSAEHAEPYSGALPRRGIGRKAPGRKT
jgi:hypothetical protein